MRRAACNGRKPGQENGLEGLRSAQGFAQIFRTVI